MQFRQVGATGIDVSVVGIGLEHLDGKPYEQVKTTIDTAMDGGVTLFDMFMPGEEVRTNIGRAFEGRRDKVIIQGAIGSVDLREQYDISRNLQDCQNYFDMMLRCLKTDYIDFGMLFFMDTHEDVDAMINNGVVEYARKMKQQGKIRAIGASAHNPDTARRLVEEGPIEMLMFSINPAFDMMPDSGDIVAMLGDGMPGQMTRMDPKRAELYRLCQSKNIGITVMKPLCAGKLLTAEHTPFIKPMTPAQCMHYALTRPAVASALPGCKNKAEVEQALAYISASEAERDYTEAIAAFRQDEQGGFKGNCVYCNHCLPCPAQIDIASVNKYLDIARLDPQSVPPSVRQHYRALSSHASDCVECGSCEPRCPFSVPVIQNMREAAGVFGQ